MIPRVLAILAAHLRETLRTPATYLFIAILLLSLPALTLVTRDETSLWVARTGTAEGLRFVMPLAAIAAAAFLLRPGMRRGWALLSARRAEWFAGTALAGAVLLLGAGLLFSFSGAVSILLTGERLERTLSAADLHLERTREGRPVMMPAPEEGLLWANPMTDERLIFQMPETGAARIEGSLEYRVAWTTRGAPGMDTPVALWLLTRDSMHEVELTPVSQTQVRFAAERPDGAADGLALMVAPADPVLVVGSSPGNLRLHTGQSGPWLSVLWLMLLAVGASLVCMCTVFAVRGYATAPTAALCGLLLLAAMTLLPGLTPADDMARERRAAMQGSQAHEARSMLHLLRHVPRLFPDEPFQELSANRVVPASVTLDGLTRTGTALLLLAPGAWLFTRREIK
jgi:hypothetical protein